MPKTKMTPAKVEKERARLADFVSQAQYDYNCAFDTKVEANNRWATAKLEMDAATEHRDRCEVDFDDCETRLFHFEEVLEDFNEEYPEDE